jgi:glyoxylase I family protein
VPAFPLSRSVVDVAIVCSDFGESVRFYRDALGLEVHQDLQIPEHLAVPSGLAPSAFHHLRLRAGDTLIKLMDISPAPAAPPEGFRAGLRWLTFFVEDLDATIVLLTERGVRFLSTRRDGRAGAFATVQAPDGVIIELVELYPVAVGTPA